MREAGNTGRGDGRRIRAKKSLGQNFLTSKRALATIVEAARIAPTNTVLEIGPGKGALTSALLASLGPAGRVIAVEKDDELIPYLQELFAAEIAGSRLTLIHGDILELGPEQLPLSSASGSTQPYTLVANIPYYITGALIRLFLSGARQPSRAVLMLQKEVARRIVARDEKESLLSLSVKAYGTPKYIDTVKAIHFKPKPNVDSAILLIDNISKDFFAVCSEEKFFTVLKAGFAHKRKLLSRNLESSFDRAAIASAFAACNISEQARAEDIALATWKCLAEKL
jgi:16S rRNA (adenine1518-N6/adenine1519-N6)-dimethyltransferase